MRNTPQGRGETPGYILEFQENRILFSGAIGVSIVAFTGLLQFSLKDMDAALIGSLVCLIISIPVNAMSVYLTTFAIQRNTNLCFTGWFLGISIAGLIATFGSLVGLFWHFHQSAGIAFCLVSIVATAFALLERHKYDE